MPQGAVIWFTGVPAAGKSTQAVAVQERLRNRGLAVVELDADEIRQNLWPDLGWTPEGRDTNTRRLAWIASLLARNGVYVLIAATAPLRQYRDRAREMNPRFVEVWVKASLETVKQRDPKGLYARGERGEVSNIAGWHMPYEEPLKPEVVIETEQVSVDEGADQVIATLERLGYLPGSGGSSPYTAEEEEKIAERLAGLGYL
jgi:adenylylsulfate kinase